AVLQVRERGEQLGGVLAERRDGTYLDEARLAQERSGAAPSDAPGCVAHERLGWLREREVEVLDEPEEAVEEVPRQSDVVVEHEQPIEARRSLQQRVQVLELAPGQVGGHGGRPGQRGAGGAEREPQFVARALELPDGGRDL